MSKKNETPQKYITTIDPKSGDTIKLLLSKHAIDRTKVREGSCFILQEGKKNGEGIINEITMTLLKRAYIVTTVYGVHPNPLFRSIVFKKIQETADALTDYSDAMKKEKNKKVKKNDHKSEIISVINSNNNPLSDTIPLYEKGTYPNIFKVEFNNQLDFTRIEAERYRYAYAAQQLFENLHSMGHNKLVDFLEKNMGKPENQNQFERAISIIKTYN